MKRFALVERHIGYSPRKALRVKLVLDKYPDMERDEMLIFLDELFSALAYQPNDKRKETL